TGDGHSVPAGKLQEALVTERVQRPEDRVRVDPEHGRQVPSWREPLTGFRLTVAYGSPYGGRDLFVEGGGAGWGLLFFFSCLGVVLLHLSLAAWGGGGKGG